MHIPRAVSATSLLPTYLTWTTRVWVRRFVGPG